MSRLVSALALGLAVALAVPASAQQPPAKPATPAPAAEAPKTKADCEKVKDMKWDEKDKKCVKAEAKK